MTEVLGAVGLLLVIEGLLYALAPIAVRRMAARLPEISDETLRGFGLAAVAVGVFVVWLARG